MKRVLNRLSRMTPKPMLPPVLALRRVTSRSGKGVYASSDVLFKGAIFGRDSIEVAEDLLRIRRKLVRRIILTIASLQGEVLNNTNEEEPGKIIHEYRTVVVDGKRLDNASRHIFNELSSRWGGSEESMAYYGSVDSTPHFIRLVGLYTDRYGTSILRHKVTLRSGHKLTLRLVVDNSMDWLMDKLSQSPSGLLAYQRHNPLGIENQVWKDSQEFYIHEDKKLANHGRPIASIEVQGLVYDALMVASRLFSEKADTYAGKARQVRDATINQLWLEDRHYFALGIDYDAAGTPRLIKTMTANPAALLDTGFFDELEQDKKQRYVNGIIQTIMGHDFLTDAGIRSRSLAEARLVPFWDYHGSFTSWPKETYDIAKGLRRQGFPRLARQLENRLVNVVFKNREYPEFLYVDGRGRVMSSSPSPHEHGHVVLIESTNNPERIQAWTVSAVVAILAVRPRAKLRRVPPPVQAVWQSDLERHILTHIPRVKRLIASPTALTARYPTYPYRLAGEDRKPSIIFPIKHDPDSQ